MQHKVALAFEDGVTRFITVEDNQTVADAAYRQRINIPVDCNDGACGTCKAHCESGTYDPGHYVEDALTADEAAKGYCLPCQVKPKSDMVLRINSTSEIAKSVTSTFTGTIKEITRYSNSVMGFKVEIPERAKLAYLPGQYVNITVPGSDLTRSYSFANDPNEPLLEFLIKLVPAGLMSSWLSGVAKVGDQVTFNGPNGSFFLRETDEPALLLAGGTGLAPVLAMVRSLARSGSKRKLRLIYGATKDEDVVELGTIQALSEQLDMPWDYVVADPDSAAGNKGYVTSLFGADDLYEGKSSIYLCGPPPMVDAVRSHVESLGIELKGFFYEKFNAAAPPKVAELVTAEVPAPLPEVLTAEAIAEHAGMPGLLVAPDNGTTRMVMGQDIFPEDDLLEPAGLTVFASETPDRLHAVMGQDIFPKQEVDTAELDGLSTVDYVPDARGVGQQEMFPALEDLPVVEAPIAAAPAASAESLVATHPVYEIGEEHPSAKHSDAIFEAREALELGALALVVGRVTPIQIGGFRRLAELTLPYIKGDRFVDAHGWTESNALFHDYLFQLTGNEHLSQAYERLGIKGQMEETLREATWCHPDVAHEHLLMVDAIEAGDLQKARELYSLHAEHSKQTMRRAMHEQAAREASGVPFFSAGRFAGKVVLVTGAAQGIGEAVARRISAEGGQLVLADRSELAEALAAELSSNGPKAVAVLGNLETWEVAQSVVDRAVTEFGRVDVAIHNVGGTIFAKPYEEYQIDQIQSEINRSLYPTLFGCRAVYPQMIKQGWGTIVNVSSIATRGLNRVPYAAAKGGVNAITASLAMEAATHNVRVVAAAPGATEAPPRKVQRGPLPQTEQEKVWYKTIFDQSIESSLMKRQGTVHEQAAVICFLASDEASYLTGDVVPVGGGDLG